ncbi:MAG: MFS transporter [Clostridia bacterium]|nr:MFS transporter [Clostridia bacterium]
MRTDAVNIETDVNIHLENRSKSRMFFLFLWLMYAGVYMTKNAFNGALASIVAEGILTKSQTGFITAMFYLVYTPLQIVGGLVSDKYSPEKIIKIGLLGAAVSNAVIYINQNYYVMLFAWMFNGVVQFGIWPAIFKIISSQLVRSDRKQMTFYISFSSTAGLVMSYLFAALVSNWRYNFSFSAMLLLVFAVALHIYEKYLNKYMVRDKAEEIVIKDNTKGKEQIPAMKVFSMSGFFFLAVSVVFSILVQQSRGSLASVMFMENYSGVSPSLGNVLTTVLIISGFVGTLISGNIIYKVKNELKVISVLLLSMLPFFAVCIFVGNIPIYIVIGALCVIAALESIAAVMRNGYTMLFAKYNKSGTAAGIINSAMAFSFMLSAYVMPRIVELYSWRTLVILWIVLILISVITVSFGIKKNKLFKSRGE